MKQFINPSPICVVCGKHRSAKGVDHSECSKQLQQRPSKKVSNKPNYTKQNPADYWEKNK